MGFTESTSTATAIILNKLKLSSQESLPADNALPPASGAVAAAASQSADHPESGYI
jgi:hypothetical protein